MIPTCPECGWEMIDVNEGSAMLRYGSPAWECQNPDCEKNPKNKIERQDED